jgi:predicted nuclease with TOPRIM domain
MSDLDQDFEALAAQINEKLATAAKAIREADELAGKANLPGLIFTQWTREDMQMDNRRSDNPKSKEDLQDEIDALEQKYELIKVRDLESALGQAGWNTSSSYC